MSYKLIFILYIFLALPVHASCTFKTGDYINELLKPQNVQQINIEVPKSAKYARNLLEVLTTRSINIPPPLKKKFKAKVTVKYPFGSCKFNGRIRQNGDGKDHVKLLAGGSPVRSLDVKLSDGNILKAIRFKLLIPETRKSENEVLATQILKHLNFISPEMFSVDVSVNGVLSTMLFQEKAEKELLERNFRRESAIFEGDEELLWSYKNYETMQLEPLSLGRLSNDNWFEKGASSAQISLSAFSKLQHSFLNYAADMDYYVGKVLDPNNGDITSEEWAFAVLVMNADHSMRPRNRQFYFNAIRNSFEPIYYDGNPNFSAGIEGAVKGKIDKLIPVQFPDGINNQFVSKLKAVLSSEALKSDFLVRAERLGIDSIGFYEAAIEQTLINTNMLASKINSTTLQKNILKEKKELIEFYEHEMFRFGVEQLVFKDLKVVENDYQGILIDGQKIRLSKSDVAQLISQNRYKDKRAVLLNISNAESTEQSHTIPIDEMMATVYASDGISHTVSNSTKTIHFTQARETDWVMISDGSLANWSINFQGKVLNEKTKVTNSQRFNAFGITGCLSFFNVELKDTFVKVSDGGCEDSLNIISSSGSLNKIQINTAFADGLDMDFSDVTINEAFIQNAGNDCYDVSSGTYRILNGEFTMCGDKGISVGEGSNFSAKNIKVQNSIIGVSVKDYSTVNIDAVILMNVTTCIEAKQKKQEFGGASGVINEMTCDSGRSEVDQHSIVKVSDNEL